MGGGTYGTGGRAAHGLAPMLPGGRSRRSRKARTGAWGPDTSNILRLDLVTQVWESQLPAPLPMRSVLPTHTASGFPPLRSLR
jgi:hypothetical protein